MFIAKGYVFEFKSSWKAPVNMCQNVSKIWTF